MKKISRSLYFGGTFDPPHNGHLAMLMALARDSWCDRVYVVPTSINPLKSTETSHPIWSSAANRMRWIELILEESREKLAPEDFQKITLCDLEISKPSTHAYTVDTLSTLQAQNPDQTQWSLAMGSDLLHSLPNWKSIEKLLSQLESVWVFARGEDQNIPDLIPPAVKLLTTFRVMSHRIPAVSSTQIRHLIEEAGSTASCNHLIPTRVQSNIQSLL